MTNMNPAVFTFPELQTARLFLRLMTEDDAPGLFKIYSDDEVTKYMDLEPFTSVQEAIAEIQFMNGMKERLHGLRYGIYDKQSGELIGTCGYHKWVRQGGCRAEIGYDLARKYWGKGLMPEALAALLTFGFQSMKLHRIEALVLPGGVQSMVVLHKLGFQEEGILRDYGYWAGKFRDEHMFSLLSDEWWRRCNVG